MELGAARTLIDSFLKTIQYHSWKNKLTVSYKTQHTLIGPNNPISRRLPNRSRNPFIYNDLQIETSVEYSKIQVTRKAI